MSTKASGEARRLLSFPSTSLYMGFLLTCLEEPAFRQGSVIYEERLNKIFIRKQTHHLHIAAFGDPELIRQLEHMAIANGGSSKPYTRLQRDKYHSKAFSVNALLRSVCMHASPMDNVRFNHLLIALYDAEAKSVSEILKRVWDLGARGVELAFVKRSRSEHPTHFVRMHGIRHADAFHAWCKTESKNIEVYAPLSTDRRESRFYALWGYRHPVSMLDQLVDLDRELVLLRPKVKGKPVAPEWITFKEGTVNFFRKAFEFTDIKVDLEERPLIELEEDTSANTVPLELAIVQKPKTGPNRIWQMDQQIDRQRLELQNLEVARSRLASGEHEEVYFAYRFDQVAENRLNPRLIRLLQQRIGTLTHYDYAFCKPRHGNPYHLVLSNRSQRQMGFSLQPADRIYYQPAQWRQWGVNLYVPLNMELAPRVDVADALPILQQFLETSNEGNGEADEYLDAAAVIWESGRDDRIDETRVAQAAPLLSQFRLLNSFQRQIAGHVEQETRNELMKGIRDARRRVDDELDGLTRDLLQHIGHRTEKLQTSFGELNKGVGAAEQLLGKIEPRVHLVREVVLELPDQWIEFVNRVIELHRKVADPEIAAAIEFREQLKVGRDELRALAARNRDLSEVAVKHRDAFTQDLAVCDQVLVDGAQERQEIDVLLKRATVVFQEIATMHKKIGDRIKRMRKEEAKASQMQTEIDEIKSRETAVAKRMEELKPLHDVYQEKAAEVEINKNQVEANEQTLARKTAELARRRADVNRRLLQASGQMERIESHLHDYSQSADQLRKTTQELDQQMALVDAHADAIRMWEGQEQSWRQYMSMQHDLAEQRIQQLHYSVDQLEEDDTDTSSLRDHMLQAKEHLAKAEAIVQRRQR